MTSKISQDLKTYLICISYNDFTKATTIIEYFITTDNKNHAELLLVENGSKEYFNQYLNRYKNEPKVRIFYSETSNKSSCLNHIIKNIKEKEALLICIDNDIKFPNDFVIKYQQTAKKKGNLFYFGGGLVIPSEISNLIIDDYKVLYQGSQSTRNDEDFKKIKDLMFFGANFCFFKSQWAYVNGFDERFAPGSKYGLAGQESIFQKKLKYVGFKAFYVNNNEIIHFPNKESYTLNKINKRIQNNGYSHGFRHLTEQNLVTKSKYFFNILAMLKACILFKLQSEKIKYIYKKNYLKGYVRSLYTYFGSDNKSSIFESLIKIKD